jgi:hypothetical protein
LRRRGSHILDSKLTDGGVVVSLPRRRPLFPGRFLVLISVKMNPGAIMLLDGLGKTKLNSMA